MYFQNRNFESDEVVEKQDLLAFGEAAFELVK